MGRRSCGQHAARLRNRGQCGIPASAQAVSFNFTVTNTSGPGFLLVFPQGGAQPNASTLDYVANQTVAKGPSPRLVHLL
jgi:hypothetical protein